MVVLVRGCMCVCVHARELRTATLPKVLALEIGLLYKSTDSPHPHPSLKMRNPACLFQADVITRTVKSRGQDTA